MNDLISRRRAIDATWFEPSYTDPLNVLTEIRDRLKVLPSAKPDRPRWTPCAEALPEDGTWNLFTDGRRISLERYKQDAEDHFYPAGRYFDLTEAVAWMELPEQAWTLPEPYEEEQDGKEWPGGAVGPVGTP